MEGTEKNIIHIIDATIEIQSYNTYKSDTYPQKLSWASWILYTVFCNHGAVAQHDNFTQNWVFLDLVVHSQALRSVKNKVLIVCPSSRIITNTQENF